MGEELPNRARVEVGTTPGSPDGVDGHLVSVRAPHSFEAEQYRTLRHTLELMRKETGLGTVGVTSPVAGDGKTTTAINLAGALAQSPETRVLLVDADLRWPSVTEQLGLGAARAAGLADAILDPGRTLEGVVRHVHRLNLSVLPAGRSPAAVYEVLKSSRVGELLEEARRRYDYVVLDTPPLVPVPDCRLLERWVDGFLIVAAAHKTPRKLVEEALNLLDASKIIGIVFNKDDRPLSGYYGYYYGYSRSSKGGQAGWWRRLVGDRAK